LERRRSLKAFIRRVILILLAGCFLLLLLTACTVSFTRDVTPPPQGIAPTRVVEALIPAPLADTAPAQAEGAEGTAPVRVDGLTISGRVTAGSGEALPGGLSADLLRFDATGSQPELLESAGLQGDGSYRFEDVSLGPGEQMIVTVSYHRATFMSRLVPAAGMESGASVDLPVEIYPTSSDASLLVADNAHFYFDLVENGHIQVLELFNISNPSGYYLLPPQDGAALIDFSLPEGAQNLQFEDLSQLDRFRVTSTGFSDMESIPRSGQVQVMFAYELPFTAANKGTPWQWFSAPAMSLSIPIPVRVLSAVVMAPGSELQLENPQLVDAGTRVLQGQNIQVFTLINLPAGGDLELKIKNLQGSGAADGTPLANLVIGLIVFALAVAVVVYWLYLQPGKSLAARGGRLHGRSPVSREAILDSILDLDDLHAAGNIAPPAYREKRASLMEELKGLRHERNDRG